MRRPGAVLATLSFLLALGVTLLWAGSSLDGQASEVSSLASTCPSRSLTRESQGEAETPASLGVASSSTHHGSMPPSTARGQPNGTSAGAPKGRGKGAENTPVDALPFGYPQPLSAALQAIDGRLARSFVALFPAALPPRLTFLRRVGTDTSSGQVWSRTRFDAFGLPLA